MDFYLGTHMPHWLAKTAVPLCIARPRLYRTGKAAIKNFPRALGPWVMDSGGFWEVTHRGGWTITPRQYVAQVQRAYDEIGRMVWAAPMDWMCEPDAHKATGRTRIGHQLLTVDNFLELRDLAPHLPFIPVLQGYTLYDYNRCIELYHNAGVDLATAPTVGLGSVCRRESTREIQEIVDAVTELVPGIRLHGFGVKKGGLQRYSQQLASADSLAWSDGGRRERPCLHPTRPGRAPAKAENNCMTYAMAWRDELLAGAA